MTSRMLPFRILCLTVVVSLASTALGGDVWMTAPQLCGGKAYSKGARDAQWQFDRDQRVSLATNDSRTMYASVFPGEGSTFVLKARVRLNDKAACRVLLGKSIFDLANSGTETELRVDGKTRTFDNADADSRTWTLLTIRRRDGKMTAEINGQQAIDLGDNTGAIQKIGLSATEGTIAVQNFVLTGELERHEAAK